LTIIYIHLILHFLTLLNVQIAHFAKTHHVDEMDWILLRMPWAGLGLRVKGWAGFEQVTRQVHEE